MLLLLSGGIAQHSLPLQGIPYFILHPLSLSLSHAASLHLFHLLLASICLTCNCYLYFFFGLTRSHSRDSEAILSYIVTRQYCDGVPEGNLSDLTLLSFSSTEEAGFCLAEPNKGVFHFQKGYQIQARRDFQSDMRKFELSYCAVAQEDVNFLEEWGTTPVATGVGISRCRRAILPKIYVAARSAALVCASCCNLVCRKLRGFN